MHPHEALEDVSMRCIVRCLAAAGTPVQLWSSGRPEAAQCGAVLERCTHVPSFTRRGTLDLVSRARCRFTGLVIVTCFPKKYTRTPSSCMTGSGQRIRQ